MLRNIEVIGDIGVNYANSPRKNVAVVFVSLLSFAVLLVITVAGLLIKDVSIRKETKKHVALTSAYEDKLAIQPVIQVNAKEIQQFYWVLEQVEFLKNGGVDFGYFISVLENEKLDTVKYSQIDFKQKERKATIEFVTSSKDAANSLLEKLEDESILSAVTVLKKTRDGKNTTEEVYLLEVSF